MLRCGEIQVFFTDYLYRPGLKAEELTADSYNALELTADNRHGQVDWKIAPSRHGCF